MRVEGAATRPLMAAAFLLVVDKRPGAAARRSLPAPLGLPELGFEAHHEVHWASATGGVRLSAWAEDDGAWATRGDDLALVVGDLRGHGGVDVPTLALLDRLPDPAADDLRGVFAAVAVTAVGDGAVVTDPIGHRLLYYGEDDEVLVVSSRAALAALVLADGSRPARDALGMCWLPLTTYRVGERSGFEGVQVARPGTTLRFHRGRVVWQRSDPFDVQGEWNRLDRPVEELAALVLDEVADALRTLLRLPATRHVLSLTGGKDSRVVLAAALRSGLATELSYETVGPPGLPDVEIATELSKALGLRHDVRFLELEATVPFGDRFRNFVELTGGMVSGWDLQTPSHHTELRYTGLCGELLRSCTRLPESAREPGRLRESFALGPTGRLGRLGLVRPPVARQLHEELLERLASEPRTEADPLDRAQAHFASSRMRFTRLGAREELAGVRRVHPLYSSTGLRAALSLDSRARQSEVLVAWMLRLASEELLAHRFTDAGWDDRAQRSVGPVSSATPAAGSPAASAAAPAPPLMASLFGTGAAGRMALLDEVFADAGNPAWDLLDRAAALEALARYPQLRTPERQELFGAATAVAWLAG